MSSVSNSSKFSVKSQQIIAEQDHVIATQDDQIARMWRVMMEAGIVPHLKSCTIKCPFNCTRHLMKSLNHVPLSMLLCLIMLFAQGGN